MKTKKNITLFTKTTKKQNIEFGMVMILIVAILSYGLENRTLLGVVILLTLITILAPVLFTPFTALWFWFSHAAGRIMSFILLTLVFILVITPVGCIRRLCGKDNLSLNQFRKSRKSVFINRDHIYTKEDMIHMF